MIGDVIFFKRTNTLVSRLISKLTDSEFTHVGLIVAYDEMTGVATMIESNRFIETRISMIQLDDNCVVYTIGDRTDEVNDLILTYAYASLGKKYDYLKVFGLFLSLVLRGHRYALFNSANRLICSELIDLTYYKAGVHRKNTLNLGNVTPSELIEVYDLQRKES